MKAQEITIKVLVKRDERDTNAPYRAISRAVSNIPSEMVHQCFKQEDVEIDDCSGYECGYEDWFKTEDSETQFDIKEKPKKHSRCDHIEKVYPSLHPRTVLTNKAFSEISAVLLDLHVKYRLTKYELLQFLNLEAQTICWRMKDIEEKMIEIGMGDEMSKKLHELSPKEIKELEEQYEETQQDIPWWKWEKREEYDQSGGIH